MAIKGKEVRYADNGGFFDSGSLRVLLADNYSELGAGRGGNDFRKDWGAKNESRMGRAMRCHAKAQRSPRKKLN